MSSDDWEERMIDETLAYPQAPRGTTRSQRRGKFVLAVQAMAGETAWLDGRLSWHEGRVAWETPRGPMTPGAAELALAQRRLNQIADHPISAERALGDASAWLARRRARLELAKWLANVVAPDLATLAQGARLGKSEALTQMVLLLGAEACCRQGLPISPATTLASCGQMAATLLLDAIEDEGFPLPGRALAALTLEAIQRQSGGVATPSTVMLQPTWIRTAYHWGRQSGLPDEPVLTVLLLAGDNGPALARRYERTRHMAHPLQAPVSLLRDLLLDGRPPEQVIALTEAMAAAEPLVARLLEYRDQLPATPSPRRRADAERLLEERQQAVADLASVVHEYARAAGDPEIIGTLTQWAHMMLDLGAISTEWATTIVAVARKGLKLPAILHGAYMAMLVDYYEHLWPRDGFLGAIAGHSVQQWCDDRLRLYINPAMDLLQQTEDPALVRRALDLDVQNWLSGYVWRDRALYGIFLDLSEQFGTGRYWSLGQTLDMLSSARQAGTVLQPLIQALSRVSKPTSERILAAVLDEVSGTSSRRDLIDLLTRVAPYVPQLATYLDAAAAHNGDVAEWSRWWTPVGTVLILDRHQPTNAQAWLEWLLPYVRRLADDNLLRSDVSIEHAVLLAVTVASGDLQLFKNVVEAVVRHTFDYSWDVLQKSIGELARFPALHAPLAQLFPWQPRRCMRVVVQAGLAGRLGPEALAPLTEVAALNAPADEIGMPPDWHALLEISPDLAPIAAAYLRAQQTHGGTLDLPSGVRRSLEQPQRWTMELEHLEHRVATQTQPAHSALVARVTNLRARLADIGAVQLSVREEVSERLRQMTAEAQLAAAEHVVQSSYRAHLEHIAGPLPADLTLDEDLLNAVLLSVDIRSNRRPLLRLLRAYVAGDHRWPERHPANIAFLERFAASGADTTAWLSAHPRAYPCEGVAGGRVHVRLERDPLRVLQMGNLFDTCLSFGGINAFSTVANACELNKRVMYARDGDGRVVARKLIGITEEGTLIGFRTYTSHGQKKGNAALHQITRHYLTQIATRCRVTMADDGTVPLLFVQHWYDDGAVAWSTDEATVDDHLIDSRQRVDSRHRVDSRQRGGKQT